MFVCTDRGRHKQTRFGDFTISADGSLHVHVHPSSLTMPNSKAGPGEGSRSSYTFRCSRCRRTVQVTQKRLMAGIVAALAAAEGDTIVIDVSKALS